MSLTELAIVGGGPVGLAAALGAALRGIETTVLEAREQSRAQDPRVFALSHGTRLILEHLGVWSYLAAAHPIRSVHVSERGAFGATALSADTIGLSALGYVVAQPELVGALRRRVTELGIDCVTGATVLALDERRDDVVARYERDGIERELAASAIALAEGGAGLANGRAVTERDYGQSALVATVEAERAADDCAYERFTPQGPIALLPVGGKHALIWTLASAAAQNVLALDDAEFERTLCKRYGSRIGGVRVHGQRAAFPLKLRFAHHVASERVVLIGNSAQTLHPVAGQGFNLGLRDAYELAAALGTSLDRRRGLAEGIRRYRAQRRVDRAGGTLFTDLLVRAFSNSNPLLACARSAALAGLDAFEPAKKFLMRRMIFGAPR